MTVLRIDSLIKRYRSPEGVTQTVIDVPSFELEAGRHVALAGESGCGKTTLLNLIAGILSADAGTIEAAGVNVTSLREAERDRWRAANLGYVFQTFNLLQGYTALENVELGMMFGPGVDRAYATTLLQRMGMSDRLHYRPRQLSVGQQQRVAVARALANRPKLVLADEPTGNLDPARAREAMTLIRDLCTEHGAALLLVSHDQTLLEQFDDVRNLADVNRAAMPARASDSEGAA